MNTMTPEKETPMTCVCCARPKADVKNRKPSARKKTWLVCDACWNNPFCLSEDCRHGEEAK